MEQNFGNLIKTGLNKKGLTQKQLAEILDKNPQEVNDWIRGRKVPQWDTLRKIIEKLDLVENVWPGYIIYVQNVAHQNKLCSVLYRAYISNL